MISCSDVIQQLHCWSRFPTFIFQRWKCHLLATEMVQTQSDRVAFLLRLRKHICNKALLLVWNMLANQDEAICICWLKWERKRRRKPSGVESAKAIHILFVGPIDSDHQSPAHTSLTPAFRKRSKVTQGQRIWKEVKGHRKFSCQLTYCLCRQS